MPLTKDELVQQQKQAEEIQLTEPVAADAEQTEMEDLINALARLRADELVADKPADLKPFGLDKPEARWRFLSGDKEVLSLLIGNRDKAGWKLIGFPGVIAVHRENVVKYKDKPFPSDPLSIADMS